MFKALNATQLSPEGKVELSKFTDQYIVDVYKHELTNAFRHSYRLTEEQSYMLAKILSPVTVMPRDTIRLRDASHPVLAAINEFCNNDAEISCQRDKTRGKIVLSIGDNVCSKIKANHNCSLVDSDRELYRQVCNTVHKDHADIEIQTMFNLAARGINGPICHRGAQNCNFKADIAYAVHSMYDVDAHTLYDIFESHDLDAMVVYLYMPPELYCAALKGLYGDTYEFREYEKHIFFSMHDTSIPYKHHKKDGWLFWSKFTKIEGPEFKIIRESVRSYGPLHVINLVRTKDRRFNDPIYMTIPLSKMLGDNCLVPNIVQYVKQGRNNYQAELEHFIVPTHVVESLVGYANRAHDNTYSATEIATLASGLKRQLKIGNTVYHEKWSIDANSYTHVVISLFIIGAIHRTTRTKTISAAFQQLKNEGSQGFFGRLFSDLGFDFVRLLDDITDWFVNKLDHICGNDKSDFYIKSDVSRLYQNLSINHKTARRLEHFQVVYLQDEIVSNTYKVYNDDITEVIAKCKRYFDKFMSFFKYKLTPAFINFFVQVGKIISDIGIEVAFNSSLLAVTTFKACKNVGKKLSKSIINRINMLNGQPMMHTTAAYYYTVYDFRYTGHDIPTMMAKLFINNDGTQKHTFRDIRIAKNGCVFSKDGLTYQECHDIVEFVKNPNGKAPLPAYSKLSDFYLFMLDLNRYRVDILPFDMCGLLLAKTGGVFDNHVDIKNIAMLAGVEINMDIRHDKKNPKVVYGTCYYFGTKICCDNFMFRMQAMKNSFRLFYALKDYKDSRNLTLSQMILRACPHAVFDLLGNVSIQCNSINQQMTTYKLISDIIATIDAFTINPPPPPLPPKPVAPQLPPIPPPRNVNANPAPAIQPQAPTVAQINVAPPVAPPTANVQSNITATHNTPPVVAPRNIKPPVVHPIANVPDKTTAPINTSVKQQKENDATPDKPVIKPRSILKEPPTYTVANADEKDLLSDSRSLLRRCFDVDLYASVHDSKAKKNGGVTCCKNEKGYMTADQFMKKGKIKQDADILCFPDLGPSEINTVTKWFGSLYVNCRLFVVFRPDERALIKTYNMKFKTFKVRVVEKDFKVSLWDCLLFDYSTRPLKNIESYIIAPPTIINDTTVGKNVSVVTPIDQLKELQEINKRLEELKNEEGNLNVSKELDKIEVELVKKLDNIKTEPVKPTKKEENNVSTPNVKIESKVINTSTEKPVVAPIKSTISAVEPSKESSNKLLDDMIEKQIQAICNVPIHKIESKLVDEHEKEHHKPIEPIKEQVSDDDDWTSTSSDETVQWHDFLVPIEESDVVMGENNTNEGYEYASYENIHYNGAKHKIITFKNSRFNVVHDLIDNILYIPSAGLKTDEIIATIKYVFGIESTLLKQKLDESGKVFINVIKVYCNTYNIAYKVLSLFIDVEYTPGDVVTDFSQDFPDGCCLISAMTKLPVVKKQRPITFIRPFLTLVKNVAKMDFLYEYVVREYFYFGKFTGLLNPDLIYNWFVDYYKTNLSVLEDGKVKYQFKADGNVKSCDLYIIGNHITATKPTGTAKKFPNILVEYDSLVGHRNAGFVELSCAPGHFVKHCRENKRTCEAMFYAKGLPMDKNFKIDDAHAWNDHTQMKAVLLKILQNDASIRTIFCDAATRQNSEALIANIINDIKEIALKFHCDVIVKTFGNPQEVWKLATNYRLVKRYDHVDFEPNVENSEKYYFLIDAQDGLTHEYDDLYDKFNSKITDHNYILDATKVAKFRAYFFKGDFKVYDTLGDIANKNVSGSFKAITGYASASKTTYAIENYPNAVFVTPTRELKHTHLLSGVRSYTQHEIFKIKNVPAELIVDEMSQFFVEYLALLQMQFPRTQIIMLGDVYQVPAVAFDTRERFTQFKDIGVRNNIRETYKIPQDIAAIINKKFGYDMMAKSEVEKGATYVDGDVFLFPKKWKSIPIICFNDNTKDRLSKAGFNASTITCYQGSRAHTVLFYIDSRAIQSHLINRGEWVYTALTRATNQLVFAGDEKGSVIKYLGILGMHVANLDIHNDIVVNSERYIKEVDLSTMISSEEEKVVTHPVTPETASEILVKEYKHTNATDVYTNVLKPNLNELENGSMYMNEDLLAQSSNGRSVKKIVSEPHVIQQTSWNQIETIQSMITRYGAARPKMNHKKVKAAATDLCEGLSKSLYNRPDCFHRIVAELKSRSYEVAYEQGQAFIRAGAKRNVDFKKVYDCEFNEFNEAISYFNKYQGKYKAEDGFDQSEKVGQGVSQFSKMLNILFSAYGAFILKTVRDVGKNNNLYIITHGSDEDFNTLALQYSDVMQDDSYKWVCNDYTEWDASYRTCFTDFFRLLLGAAGCPKQLLDWYDKFSANWKMVYNSRIGTVKLYGSEKNFSGGPLTIVVNTIGNIALSFSVFGYKDIAVSFWKGDDSGCLCKDCEITTRGANLLKLTGHKTKLHTYDVGEFAGYIITSAGIFPDVVRQTAKFLGKEYRNVEHFGEVLTGIKTRVAVVKNEYQKRLGSLALTTFYHNLTVGDIEILFDFLSNASLITYNELKEYKRETFIPDSN